MRMYIRSLIFLIIIFGSIPAKPFSFLGNLNPEDVMQVNEGREAVGLTADENKEGVYIFEVKAKQNVQNQPAPPQGANNT